GTWGPRGTPPGGGREGFSPPAVRIRFSIFGFRFSSSYPPLLLGGGRLTVLECLRAGLAGRQLGLRPLGALLNVAHRGQAHQDLVRDVEVLAELLEAALALQERTRLVALGREALPRFRAAVLERRVEIAAEQRGDVDLHRLALDVFLADDVAV